MALVVRRLNLLAGLVGPFLILVTAVPAGAQIGISRLHCEYASNPLGIDVARPMLGWAMESGERGLLQSGYQVLVASNKETLKQDRGDLWDSGKVDGGNSIQIEYAGRPLTSGQRVWWKVRIWDNHDHASAWSQPAWWEMALLEPTDWTGRWICSDSPLPKKDKDFYADHPAPLFRKEFILGKKIAKARAYVSGLGYYELYLNGRRVGVHVLDPGWTSYAKRVPYSTYDVTDLLKEGQNAAGAMVGNGWYNPLPLRLWGRINIRKHLAIGKPRLILQLNVEYADGTREAIVTDETWKVGDSAMLRNNVYLGEVYDARREQPGWDSPGFGSEGKQDAPLLPWRAVALSTETIGPLQTHFSPPIRVTRTLKPAAITEPQPGVYIFDLGQNFAGWVRFKASAPAGTTAKLRYGELLYPDGTLNVMTSVCGQIKRPGLGGPGAPDVAYQSDTYIFKGDGVETYTPRFTFHGFRYVEVTGLPAKPPLEAIEGLRLNSDVRLVGKFECSDPLFNRIHEMFQWTMLSNMFSLQSDCPHREKFSYGGDAVPSSEAAIFNFDMSGFYAQTVRNHADAARPNGGLTETSPFVGINDEGLTPDSGPIEWGMIHPLLLEQLHGYYGNRRLIAEQYSAAKRWVDFLRAHAKENLIQTSIGDHESLVPKPTPITSTAFYCYHLKLMAELAGILGRADDARQYKQFADQVTTAFNNKFLQPNTGIYGQQVTQAAQAIAFGAGLVPPDKFEAAFDALTHDVTETHKNHLTTGIFGTKYLLTVLSNLGRPDLAYAIALQKDFPGWGYMLERGATTMWEHWEFSDNIYSHNHAMFGAVDEWFYRVVAGINPAADAVGFDKIVIRPLPGGGLTWAKAQYDSVRGLIRSEWEKKGDTFALRVTIPVNATAEVHVPAGKSDRITESGDPVDEAVGIRFNKWENGAAIYTVGSGDYRFEVRR